MPEIKTKCTHSKSNWNRQNHVFTVFNHFLGFRSSINY